MASKYGNIENDVQNAACPETVELCLTKEINRIGLGNLNELPRPVGEAVKYWMILNEPAAIHEAPKQVAVHGKQDAMRWQCPYHERLTYTLRSFHGMNAQQRSIVLAGVLGEQIPWRGEEIDFYLRVINETQKMRKVGIEKYRKNSIKEMKKLLNNQPGKRRCVFLPGESFGDYQAALHAAWKAGVSKDDFEKERLRLNGWTDHN